MRVYHDVSPNNTNVLLSLCELRCQHSNLDFSYVGDTPGHGSLIGVEQNIWRFLPMADPLVDVFASRDLDSRPTQREVDAVQEWLKSGLTLHVMRDHYYHDTAILGGMWGASVQTERDLLHQLMGQMVGRGRHGGNKHTDQPILAAVVWPNMKGKVMQHDSFHCSKYASHGHMMPWPSRRSLEQALNFVGASVGLNTEPFLKQCPAACRPPAHANWTNC